LFIVEPRDIGADLSSVDGMAIVVRALALDADRSSLPENPPQDVFLLLLGDILVNEREELALLSLKAVLG
jgi:hypothetical protein